MSAVAAVMKESDFADFVRFANTADLAVQAQRIEDRLQRYEGQRNLVADLLTQRLTTLRRLLAFN